MSMSVYTKSNILCRLEENDKLVLTPFEKNIDIWRQLWRVLERSDLVSYSLVSTFIVGTSSTLLHFIFWCRHLCSVALSCAFFGANMLLHVCSIMLIILMED